MIRQFCLCTLALAGFLAFFAPAGRAADFASRFNDTHNRVWVGPEYWANPMEDWRIHDGRLECIVGGGDRNVHLLTRQLGKKAAPFTLSVIINRLDAGPASGSAGFRIGITDSERDDYRTRLIYGDGLNAGVTTAGVLFVGDQSLAADPVIAGWLKEARGVELRLRAEPEGNADTYQITLEAGPASTPSKATRLVAEKIPALQLYGNLALVNNHKLARLKRDGGARFSFRDWRFGGDKIEQHDGRAFGPIFWSMHTLSRGVLKMTAQMPPIGEKEEQSVRLQIRNGADWKTAAEANIAPLSCTATVRVADWDDSRDVPYRLAYTTRRRDGTTAESYWTGTVRKDPLHKDSLVVAAFTGNADYGFPNNEIVRNLEKQNPDVLFFSGDQIYEYVGGYGIIREPAHLSALNYLRKWLLLGLAFGDLLRDRPSVAIPDDHDVYQGNIWGNGGNPISQAMHEAGGYVQPADMVNAVHRTQTAHLPDPFDPTPIQQNISVYYCDMLYGRVSFAVIADRMFKSGPRGVATWKGRPDHLKDPRVDVKTLDKPGLHLLGDRQLKFLEHWAADWKGADMKCVLSQTIFCNLANYHGAQREYLIADLDSGGWPQSARNRALHEMRRGFALHLAGDQHLASIVHHGIDAPADACYSFCVPSIANFYPRRWVPDEEGKPAVNRAGGLPNTGDYVDGLGNHIRVHAIGNPEEKYRKTRIESLHDKASGYGIVRFNRKDRTITMECYRLLVDVARDDKSQFPGWPKTISMFDNDGRKAKAFLPTLKVSGLTDPVVQVIDEANQEVVYTVRIKGTEFRPKVFREGRYTLKVGESGTDRLRILRGVAAPAESTVLEVKLN